MTPAQPIPLQITFRNLAHSDAVDTQIREKLDKLATFYQPIDSCRVTVEQIHKHHLHGNPYRVRIDLTVPGHDLIADRVPEENHAYTDVHVALRDAFSAMRRQLEDLKKHQQGHVKQHAEKPRGHITEISPDKTVGKRESVNRLTGTELDKGLT